MYCMTRPPVDELGDMHSQVLENTAFPCMAPHVDALWESKTGRSDTSGDLLLLGLLTMASKVTRFAEKS